MTIACLFKNCHQKLPVRLTLNTGGNQKNVRLTIKNQKLKINSGDNVEEGGPNDKDIVLRIGSLLDQPNFRDCIQILLLIFKKEFNPFTAV